MKPVDVIAARRYELRSKPFVAVVRPTGCVRSPDLVDGAAVAVKKATDDVREEGFWHLDRP